MKKYKLTDQDGFTRRGQRNETLWGENVTHTAAGDVWCGVRRLCTEEVIHYYDSPLVARLMNPLHAKLKHPICWECRGRRVAHDGTKGGCKTLTMIRQVPLPELTVEQRVEIGIRAALAVCDDPVWRTWATLWLSGENRDADCCAGCYAGCHAAPWAAAQAAARAAAQAAIIWPARAARAAVRTAAQAASAAVEVNPDLNLAAICEAVTR